MAKKILNTDVEVAGKLRLDTIENGEGNFITRDLEGDIQERSPSQVREDIGAVSTQGGTIDGNLQVNSLDINTEEGYLMTDANGRVVSVQVDPSGDKNHRHYQGTPSDTWTIVHNLNKRPSVFVTDSAGTVCVGDINYIDLNQLTISFNGAFSGYAELN
ncbi:hypothetical protein PP178_03940 [Zeaxanthinibacter sp. PT1]|uniref:hypothetical protein n=1 Tax=Zeaxanthinibacter TaxID=561554 RepID=UPI00234A1E73|nr:hypothetical protein [Zeaxanthinibacter sp. PT1]MDC6350691.1 hypothetical protein [Zeaxanthinibacter sp. PT1]